MYMEVHCCKTVWLMTFDLHRFVEESESWFRVKSNSKVDYDMPDVFKNIQCVKSIYIYIFEDGFLLYMIVK